jgi:membrane-associated phospholipid phosphatase
MEELMGNIHIKRILAVISAVLVYLYLSLTIPTEGPISLDEPISNVVKNMIGGGLLDVFSLFGSTKGFAFAAVIVLIWLGFRKKYLAIGVFVLALLSGYVMNSILKDWHNRPRPASEQLVEVNTLSFPSGNAMIGFILYSLTAYYLMRNLKSGTSKFVVGLGAFLIILLYGMSRVALNVHYPSDIIAGFAIGVVWTVSWLYIYEGLTRKFWDDKKSKISLPL